MRKFYLGLGTFLGVVGLWMSFSAEATWQDCLLILNTMILLGLMADKEDSPRK